MLTPDAHAMSLVLLHEAHGPHDVRLIRNFTSPSEQTPPNIHELFSATLADFLLFPEKEAKSVVPLRGRPSLIHSIPNLPSGVEVIRPNGPVGLSVG
jgi:hypothetical protein